MIKKVVAVKKHTVFEIGEPGDLGGEGIGTPADGLPGGKYRVDILKEKEDPVKKKF